MPARCWSVPVLAAACSLALAPLAPAQEVKSEDIQFRSADGVELMGKWYKSVIPTKKEDKIVSTSTDVDAPVVILLQPYLATPGAKEWDGLAVLLASRGFHVLTFDFRGHNKSTVISPKRFWDSAISPENAKAFPTLARAKPVTEKLENAQVKAKPGYWPVMVNDIIAARVDLDIKNDDRKLNTSSVYLIAVGDAAPLALMYTAAEWTRPQTLTETQAKVLEIAPLLPILDANTRETTAAHDIAATILIAPTYPASGSITERNVTSWSKTFTEMRKANAVLCIHGDGDEKGKKFSKSLVEDVLIANPRPGATVTKLPFTAVRELKKSKLTGVDMINATKSPDTEKQILDYLTAVEKDRGSKQRVTRNYKIAPYISPAYLGVNIR